MDSSFMMVKLGVGLRMVLRHSLLVYILILPIHTLWYRK